MISFIDEHSGAFGVEPICILLPIAPSTYYENIAKRLDVDRLSVRARSDISLKVEIRRVFEQNFASMAFVRSGGNFSWKSSTPPVARLEGDEPARCHSGEAYPCNVLDKTDPNPLDWVNRQVKAPAPNRL